MANSIGALNTAQLEILKVLAHPMSEEEILDLKRTIVRHFAKKLTQEADKHWDKNNWKEEDTEELRKRHFRTSYTSDNKRI